MAGSDLSARTITVPSIVSHFTDAELNSGYHAKTDYENAITKYGAIYKVISFSEISDMEEIKTQCRKWIKDNYYDGVVAFTVKAVDLHLLGYQKDKILVGDRIEVEFLDGYNAPVTKRLTCLSAQYDLLKPENSTYRIGIPDVSANRKYRKSLGTSSTKKPPSGGGQTPEETREQIHKELFDYGLIVYE